jgi:hypothetical protein
LIQDYDRRHALPPESFAPAERPQYPPRNVGTIAGGPRPAQPRQVHLEEIAKLAGMAALNGRFPLMAVCIHDGALLYVLFQEGDQS